MNKLDDGRTCAQIDLKKFDCDREALILYTSGTSGPPKGVVITFKNLVSSIQTMIDAWQWSEKDCMLSTLPLNHYSGKLNLIGNLVQY